MYVIDNEGDINISVFLFLTLAAADIIRAYSVNSIQVWIENGN